MAATRTYNSEKRLRKQADLRARIAAAAADLHARKGALATSYADIASEAGVSLPTVYAHFPTMDALLDGCTRHVAGRAPTLPAADILEAPTLAQAAERLVDAMEQQHLHFEPWLSWRENRVIPFLADLSGRVRDELAALIARVLRRHCGPGGHRASVAAWETALSFDAWHRLARGHRLSRPAARRATLQCLLATAPPQARTNLPRSKT
jgi:AcrR family transcriptional regulator